MSAVILQSPWTSEEPDYIQVTVNIPLQATPMELGQAVKVLLSAYFSVEGSV